MSARLTRAPGIEINRVRDGYVVHDSPEPPEAAAHECIDQLRAEGLIE
jgi:hypothetical protein